MSFQIEDFTPAAPENPYDEAVQALIDAGEGKALTIAVPTTDPAKEGEKAKVGRAAERERLKFQKAANAKGFTARVVRTAEDVKAGTTAYTFRLKAQETRPRKAKGDSVDSEGTASE